MFSQRQGPLLFLPAVQSQVRYTSPKVSMNTNAIISSSFPKSFPLSIEGREEFFCVDPNSLTIEQLNKYKEEMLELIKIENDHFEKINENFTARIHAYNQGISLAEQIIYSNSTSENTKSRITFHPTFKRIDHESIGFIDPKCLTITQLQLYIEGISEDMKFWRKLLNECRSESTARIEAYKNGIQRADYG